MANVDASLSFIKRNIVLILVCVGCFVAAFLVWTATVNYAIKLNERDHMWINPVNGQCYTKDGPVEKPCVIPAFSH